ncbi:hypothetical protein [Hamadaea tsunoensis]|uniref:hypothetical protein n=1 Tax=Hamadaea tsunoensis TaxID=53368 RepID=UPI0012FC949E|nr:hypothetical protein [Hamadaea tsunoensis]
MSTQIATPPVHSTTATGTAQVTTTRADEVHRSRQQPHEHLCTCGRVREECVRERVRALWSS